MENQKLFLPILGAIVTAIVGGALWAVIAIWTNYEIGFLAWGVGWLAGYAMFYLSKGKVSQVHQVIAVITSLIGILLGKYFIVGYESGNGISGIVQSDVMSLFVNHLSASFGIIDLLFGVLAIRTAWRLPLSLAHKAKAKQPEIDLGLDSTKE